VPPSWFHLFEPPLRPEDADDALGIYDLVGEDPTVGQLDRDRFHFEELRLVVVAGPSRHESLGEKELDRPG
jgi:hypothetical protein